MKLEILSLFLKNFKSFRDETQIDLDYRGVGLHFLRGVNKAEPRLGSNGAGKSTLWDALTWCLYGRTVKELRNPDVPSWGISGLMTYVGAIINADDNRLVITRSTNPNKLLVDNEPVGQEQLEQLIGLNFDAFCSTLLLGQGRPLFFDMAPREKMELFSSVLDLDRWEERSKAAAKSVNSIEKDLREIDGELIGLSNEEAGLKAMVEQAATKAEDWEADRQEKLKGLEGDLKGLEKEFDAASKRFEKADLDYDMASTELNAVRNEVRRLEKLQVTATDKVSKLQALQSSICPTCGQPIKKHKVSAEDLRQAKEQVAKSVKELRTHESNEEELIKKVRATDGALRLYRQQQSEAKIKYEVALEAQAAREEEVNPFKIQIRGLKNRQKELTSRRADLDKETISLGRLMERTRYWVKGFRDVRLHVIEEILQELELTTNAMLDDVGLVGWEIRYDIEKETKAGTIKSGLNVSVLSPRNDKAVRWESWSGGEGQRLRIIGALALSDVLLNNAGIEPGFEILDEPTSHLSKEGVRDIVDYLADRAHMLQRQIWLTDQTAIEGSAFETVLTVIKDPVKGSHISDVGQITGSPGTGTPPKGSNRVQLKQGRRSK